MCQPNTQLCSGRIRFIILICAVVIMFLVAVVFTLAGILEEGR